MNGHCTHKEGVFQMDKIMSDLAVLTIYSNRFVGIKKAFLFPAIGIAKSTKAVAYSIEEFEKTFSGKMMR